MEDDDLNQRNERNEPGENEPDAGPGAPELEDRDTEQEQQQFAERQEAEMNGQPEEPLVDGKETMSGKASSELSDQVCIKKKDDLIGSC